MTFYFDRPPTGVSAQQLIDAGAAEPITFAALTPGIVALGGVGYGRSTLIRPAVQISDLAVVKEPVTAGLDDEPTDGPDTDRDPESAA